jgi:hypothetical protein
MVQKGTPRIIYFPAGYQLGVAAVDANFLNRSSIESETSEIVDQLLEDVLPATGNVKRVVTNTV